MQVDGKRWQPDASWGSYHVTRVNDQSSIDLKKALIVSDNIYFAQAALDLGREKFIAGLKDIWIRRGA